MVLTVALTTAFVVAAVGALLYWHSRGRFSEVKGQAESTEARLQGQIESTEARLQGQIESTEARLQGQISELRAEVNRKFELMMTEILAVRSDLTHIALALGAPPRPQASQG